MFIARIRKMAIWPTTVILTILFSGQFAFAADDKKVAQISAVTVNHSSPNVEIIIYGSSLLDKKGQMPTVYIGDYIMHINSASQSEIIGSLDDLSVGDYRIFVDTKGEGKLKDGYTYDLTIGAVGPQGPQGDKGDSGVQGIPGAQGPVGNNGLDGAQGIKGPAGLQGDTGNTGSQGIAGVQGIQGETGETGEPGSSLPKFTYVANSEPCEGSWCSVMVQCPSGTSLISGSFSTPDECMHVVSSSRATDIFSLYSDDIWMVHFAKQSSCSYSKFTVSAFAVCL